MFDVHPNTVRKWVKTGILHSIKLPGSRYNRFTTEEVTRLRREMALPADHTLGLHRVSEVAQMFDVHPNTIRKWVKTSILRPVKLPGSRYNRFTAEEINRLRREMRLPADKTMALYRVGEVAKMFDVHANTIRKWVKTNILHPIKLPGSRYNRFTVEEVNRLRREMQLPPVEEKE